MLFGIIIKDVNLYFRSIVLYLLKRQLTNHLPYNILF